MEKERKRFTKGFIRLATLYFTNNFTVQNLAKHRNEAGPAGQAGLRRQHRLSFMRDRLKSMRRKQLVS